MEEIKKGTVLENTYEIIEEIGSGGGGIVYKARHLRLETDVVVKKIKDEVLDKVETRKEADILKKLKHPYLPRVYDFIETPDGVYTVMDFIQGDTLEDVIKKEGRLPQKKVKKWAEQMGEALSYLHSQNPPIIHSDIKPANIMLTKEGDVCLIDFNISLALGSPSKSAVGISARYSPPEQYRDPALYERITHNYTINGKAQEEKQIDVTEAVQPEDHDKTELLKEEENDKTEILKEDEDRTEILQAADSTSGISDKESNSSVYDCFIGKGIDTRSDIYSLGVTLYYLLTGLEPALEFEKRIPIEDTKAVLSEGFAIIINKMIELAPENRYQNGSDYLKAVKNCHKLDTRYRRMKFRQNGLQLAALGSLILGIVCVFSGIMLIRKETDSAYYTLLAQAESAVEGSQYEQAAVCLEEAEGMLPLRIDAYKDKIHMLYRQADYDGCIEQGTLLINAQPFVMETEADWQMYGDIYYLTGNAYYEQRDYANASKMLADAISYNAKNALYYRDYAITLARCGKVKEAEKQLQKAAEIGAAVDSLSMAEGEIFHAKGENEQAAASFLKAISTAGDTQMKKRAILLCADTYKSMGNQWIDKEIVLLEENRDGFDQRGNMVLSECLADAYVRKAQTEEENTNVYYEKALVLFQEIYENGYITYQLQENMAILYENMEVFDKAEEILFQMAEDYPEKYQVYKRLAYLEADKQQQRKNEDRDYNRMKKYYEQAKNLYSPKLQDMEMDMLKQMMVELEDGGWFTE